MINKYSTTEEVLEQAQNIRATYGLAIYEKAEVVHNRACNGFWVDAKVWVPYGEKDV